MEIDVDRAVSLVRGPDGKGKVSIIEVADETGRHLRIKGYVAIIVPEAAEEAKAWAEVLNSGSNIENTRKLVASLSPDRLAVLQAALGSLSGNAPALS